MYVNAFGLEIQPEGQTLEGHSTVTVTVSINHQSQEFLAYLLQGGHRLLLPENAKHLIVEALQNNYSVEISVASYTTTIIPDDFGKHYQKFIE